MSKRVRLSQTESDKVRPTPSGVDRGGNGCEHGGDGANGGNVPVGVEFVEHDSSVQGEFNGLEFNGLGLTRQGRTSSDRVRLRQT